MLQALGMSEVPLPRGAVCDSCNSYLGELDRNFCDHHHLAAMIVFGQLPGTKDRLRKQVHPEFSFDAERQHLVTKGGTGSWENGTLTIRHPGNRTFSAWKFSRGLHRMALGALALLEGEETALQPRYDGVRSYIRAPNGRHEFWPYRQRPSDRLLGNRSFPRALTAQGFKASSAVSDSATFIYLNLFVSEFVVALDSELNQLYDAHLQQLASAAPEPRSTRPWQYHDGSNEPEVILTPDMFRQSSSEKE